MDQAIHHTPVGSDETVYISLDKSAATIKKDKLFKLLDQVLGRGDTQRVRSEFAISWQWKILANIRFDETTNEARIAWVRETAEEAGIDPEGIDKLVR